MGLHTLRDWHRALRGAEQAPVIGCQDDAQCDLRGQLIDDVSDLAGNCIELPFDLVLESVIAVA